MRQTPLQRLCLPFMVIALVLLVGCSGKKAITVQGKVIPPSAIKLMDTDSIEIRFLSDQPNGPSAATSASGSDLSFETQIVPGKYKVGVKLAPYPGMTGYEKRISAFQPFNDANDIAASQMTVEVTAKSPQTITIDLDKKTVSAN